MKNMPPVALVTGASGAIGGAVAKRLAGSGYRIFITSHANPDRAESLASELRSDGALVSHHNLDLVDASAVASLIGSLEEEVGRLDALVNVAGSTIGGGRYSELTPHEWIVSFEVNLVSAMNLIKFAAPLLLASELGRVVSVASVRGLEHCGREAIVTYSAAKAALISASKTLAKDLAPTVLVNTISPGFVWTKNYEAMPQEVVKAFVDETPLGRFITVDEIAEVAEFLISQSAITGQNLVVDGGFSLKLA